MSSPAARARIAVPLVIAVAVLLRLPTVWAGFGMDDFAHLAMLGGAFPVDRSPLDLYTFSSGDPAEVQALRDAGFLPWWSHPQLRLSAMRPLSSLLIALDVRLWGHHALLFHLHSLLWWVALLWVVWRLVSRVLPRRWAVLTLALYAFDEAHTYPLAWLANRNALVSAVFGFAAVAAYVRWREQGSRGALGWSLVLLAGSFAGGEYALCAFVYLVAYELVGADGPWRQRARALVGPLSVFAIWALLHRALGYGAYASAIYVDPLREPLMYLQAVADRVPLLVAEMIAVVPSGEVAFKPWLVEHRQWLGPATLALMAVLLPGAWRRMDAYGRRRTTWMLVAALASILPVAPSITSSRLLLLPALAGHVVLAAVFLDAWDRVRSRPQSAIAHLRTLVIAALAVAHFALAPWSSVQQSLAIRRLHEGMRAFASGVDVDPRQVANQRLVVLTANDPMTLVYPPLVFWLEGKPMPRSWWVLSMAPSAHRLYRIGPTTIELEVVDGAMLRGPVEQLFRRADMPLRLGSTIELDGMTVTVLATASGGGPWRVRYAFDRPVDDAAIQFLLVTKDGIRRYPMGPVGGTMPIPAGALPVPL